VEMYEGKGPGETRMAIATWE